MRVGIKYCGGCRAAFDRKAEAELVKQAAPDIVFSDAADGERYDALLAVCGCRSRCADVSPYSADKTIYIHEAGGAEAASEEIKTITEEKNGG